MKRTVTLLFFIALSLSSCLLFSRSEKREHFSYLLNIQLPSHIQFHTPIPGFYKGTPLKLGKNCTSFSGDTQALTVLITPQASFESVRGNNIRGISRLPDQPFCWYDLTLRADINGKAYVWEIKKLDAKEAPLQIPEHAIILCFNPEFIEGLKTPGAIETSGTIALPTIIIRSDTEQEPFDAACNEAWLASLELRTIHQEPSVHIQKEPQVIISLCNKQHIY